MSIQNPTPQPPPRGGEGEKDRLAPPLRRGEGVGGWGQTPAESPGTAEEVGMRSKAQFKGHPLHPALVAFPVAFLYGSLAFDLAGAAGGWPVAWSMGGWLSLAALGCGLIAAIPGLIDYFYVVPPASSARNRATWHLSV